MRQKNTLRLLNLTKIVGSLYLFGIIGNIATPARAAVLDSTADLKISWDNDLRLGTSYQFEPELTGYIYKHAANEYYLTEHYLNGFTSGRLDWLSRLDIDGDHIGLHVSSEGWYDAAGYVTDPTAKTLILIRGGDGLNYFTTTPEERHDRALELGEAFIHGTVDLKDAGQLSFRFGRHVLLWGESQYFISNSIAGAQTPVDFSSARLDSAYDDRDRFRPVGQASFSWRPTSNLVINGYYQFEFRPDRIDVTRSYSDVADFVSAQSRSQIDRDIPGTVPVFFQRQTEETPPSTDQYGLAMKWQDDDLDLGLYAISFNAKSPIGVFQPVLQPARSAGVAFGQYGLFYPAGIKLYGASVSGSLGDASFGAEISGRVGMPLLSRAVFIPANHSDLNDLPIPLGDTLHGQISGTVETDPLPAVPAGASVSGELATNCLLSVTSGLDQRAPSRTPCAGSVRVVFEPRFYQILPGLDVTVPLSIGYALFGKSAVDALMYGGTGDVSVGLSGRFSQVWRAKLEVTGYFGGGSSGLYGKGVPVFEQLPGTGSFIAASISRSF